MQRVFPSPFLSPSPRGLWQPPCPHSPPVLCQLVLYTFCIPYLALARYQLSVYQSARSHVQAGWISNA